MSSEPGHPGRFADYHLLDTGKEGGMGVVFRARQISLDRIVAIKVIRGAFFATPSQIQRFRAEAEAAASLDHPGIVPVYGVGEHEGRHFFTMKWIEGGSLADALRSYKERLGQAQYKVGDPRSATRNLDDSLFTPRGAAKLVVSVAKAIHHAHQRGVIHRDLKPSNILLDGEGQSHVSDFGLAKRLDSSAGLTLSEQTLGTPAYMAPEQAAGQTRDATTAVDIFSLGAILYEMLTGQPAFIAPTAAATMHKVLTEQPKRPSTLARRLPADLETICLKCLEKEPSLRYSTAEAVAVDLEHWLRDEPISARPVGLFGRVQRWARRKPAIAGLAAVLVLVAVLGLGGTVWQLKESRESLKRYELMTQILREILNSQRPDLDTAEATRALESVLARVLTRFADQPGIRSELLGRIFISRGKYREAKASLLAAVESYRKERVACEDIAAEINKLDQLQKRQPQQSEPARSPFENWNWDAVAPGVPGATNICAYDAGLGTLPEAQGFVAYDNGGARRATVARGVLRMPGNPKLGGYQYWYATNRVFDLLTNAYAIEASLRIVSAEDMVLDASGHGFHFEVIDSVGYQVMVTIGTNAVSLKQGRLIADVPFHAGDEFHNYRLVVRHRAVALFIDGTLFCSGPVVGPPQHEDEYANRVFFGDGSGWGTSEVELRGFRVEALAISHPPQLRP